jgi:hypothetical protein
MLSDINALRNMQQMAAHATEMLRTPHKHSTAGSRLASAGDGNGCSYKTIIWKNERKPDTSASMESCR